MTKTNKVQLRINQNLKDKFGEYCKYHKSTITDQIEQFMILCIQFHDKIQQHAQRPLAPEKPDDE